MSEVETLIIGAGPAGMAAAMELSKVNKKILIIEKQKSVGGLAKTLTFEEEGATFFSDIGPHRFFSQNKYLYDFIENLIHDKWIKVNRLTRQYIGGKFYDYPINAAQALKNIGMKKAFRIFLDYLFAQIVYKILRKKIKNFKDYVIANFGRSLAELNMINYTEKVWGIECSKIHPDWAKQRIKSLTLISALKSIFTKGKDPRSMVDQFYYPEDGTHLIYKTIEEKIIQKGNEVLTESYPTKIKHDGKLITEVIINTRGKEESFKPKYLVESITMKNFVNLLEPSAPDCVLEAIKTLKYRSQVYLFITLDKESITKDQWIYFPEKEIPFGRVSEMKNFSKKMSPDGKTSLFVEFFCFEGDKTWNMDKESLFELALNHFERLGFFTRKEVRNYYLIKQKNVYPIYDLDYQKNLELIKAYLNKFENLFFIGRPGRFKYNNQDHSLEMGILAARSIIDEKKYDIESVGSEIEYYEKGDLNVSNKQKVSFNWMVLEDRDET
ncbi:hypothetical protein CMI37_20250 [Candidatus Pacearchaeota archaeon]|nr:hypothetical protein [Candidatus Pacearchaeota archaeon]|tara:strand:+ start:2288 stop:3775 length:1488 start_codon:yes stop_codon:yes gene_type:complete